MKNNKFISISLAAIFFSLCILSSRAEAGTNVSLTNIDYYAGASNLVFNWKSGYSASLDPSCVLRIDDNNKLSSPDIYTNKSNPKIGKSGSFPASYVIGLPLSKFNLAKKKYYYNISCQTKNTNTVTSAIKEINWRDSDFTVSDIKLENKNDRYHVTATIKNIGSASKAPGTIDVHAQAKVGNNVIGKISDSSITETSIFPSGYSKKVEFGKISGDTNALSYEESLVDIIVTISPQSPLSDSDRSNNSLKKSFRDYNGNMGPEKYADFQPTGIRFKKKGDDYFIIISVRNIGKTIPPSGDDSLSIALTGVPGAAFITGDNTSEYFDKNSIREYETKLSPETLALFTTYTMKASITTTAQEESTKNNTITKSVKAKPPVLTVKEVSSKTENINNVQKMTFYVTIDNSGMDIETGKVEPFTFSPILGPEFLMPGYAGQQYKADSAITKFKNGTTKIKLTPQ